MFIATIFTAVLRYLYRFASAITESTQFKEMEKESEIQIPLGIISHIRSNQFCTRILS